MIGRATGRKGGDEEACHLLAHYPISTTARSPEPGPSLSHGKEGYVSLRDGPRFPGTSEGLILSAGKAQHSDVGYWPQHMLSYVKTVNVFFVVVVSFPPPLLLSSLPFSLSADFQNTCILC